MSRAKNIFTLSVLSLIGGAVMTVIMLLGQQLASSVGTTFTTYAAISVGSIIAAFGVNILLYLLLVGRLRQPATAAMYVFAVINGLIAFVSWAAITFSLSFRYYRCFDDCSDRFAFSQSMSEDIASFVTVAMLACYVASVCLVVVHTRRGNETTTGHTNTERL